MLIHIVLHMGSLPNPEKLRPFSFEAQPGNAGDLRESVVLSRANYNVRPLASY